MISTVTIDDIATAELVAAKAIRTSVALNETEIAELLQHISQNFERWKTSPDQSLFLKYTQDGEVIGVILVKDFWNLSDIYVLPKHYRKGIGRQLTEKALEICAQKSPKNHVRTNSSPNAVGFYKSLGFQEIEWDKELPYGCVPFIYHFDEN